MTLTIRCKFSTQPDTWEFERMVGQVPVMVLSDACHLRHASPRELVEAKEETMVSQLLSFHQQHVVDVDADADVQELGGYFVINGIERVIRMLMMPRRNYVSLPHHTQTRSHTHTLSLTHTLTPLSHSITHTLTHSLTLPTLLCHSPCA